MGVVSRFLILALLSSLLVSGVLFLFTGQKSYLRFFRIVIRLTLLFLIFFVGIVVAERFL